VTLKKFARRQQRDHLRGQSFSARAIADGSAGIRNQLDVCGKEPPELPQVEYAISHRQFSPATLVSTRRIHA
jgi:hypothetical protein